MARWISWRALLVVGAAQVAIVAGACSVRSPAREGVFRRSEPSEEPWYLELAPCDSGADGREGAAEATGPGPDPGPLLLGRVTDLRLRSDTLFSLTHSYPEVSSTLLGLGGVDTTWVAVTFPVILRPPLLELLRSDLCERVTLSGCDPAVPRSEPTAARRVDIWLIEARAEPLSVSALSMEGQVEGAIVLVTRLSDATSDVEIREDRYLMADTIRRVYTKPEHYGAALRAAYCRTLDRLASDLTAAVPRIP